jgi:hypothetical protein
MGKTGTEPRPSFAKLSEELLRLQQSLLTIREERADQTGELNDAQLAQVDAAIKEINAATTLVDCIQDQAPYNFPVS